jgi:hypothetical protein
MTRKSSTSPALQEVKPKRAMAVTARIRWLVNFGQQPSGPINFRSKDRIIGTLGAHLREVVLRRERSGEVVEFAALPLRGDDDDKSVGEKLALIRGTIQTLLKQHLSKRGPWPEAQVMLRLTVNGDGGLSRRYETDDVRDAVAYVLLLELGVSGHRLRRCPAAKCERLFVRQGRQRYCSAACRNRATFKRWYEVHIQGGPGSGKTAFLVGLRGMLQEHEGHAVRKKKNRDD